MEEQPGKGLDSFVGAEMGNMIVRDEEWQVFWGNLVYHIGQVDLDASGHHKLIIVGELLHLPLLPKIDKRFCCFLPFAW